MLLANNKKNGIIRNKKRSQVINVSSSTVVKTPQVFFAEIKLPRIEFDLRKSNYNVIDWLNNVITNEMMFSKDKKMCYRITVDLINY